MISHNEFRFELKVTAKTPKEALGKARFELATTFDVAQADVVDLRFTPMVESLNGAISLWNVDVTVRVV